MFSEETGIAPARVFYPDWLHDLALGVFKFYCVTLFHRLVAANAFMASGDASARLKASAARIRDLLYPWYDAEQAAGRKWARAPRIAAETFGPDEHSTLALYGEETLGLLHFCPTLLDGFGAHLPARECDQLQRLGRSLIGIHTIIVDHKQMGPLPTQAAQE